ALQTLVTERFYSYLTPAFLTPEASSWQMALATAKGQVLNKFKLMHRTVTEVVAFVNILDLYEYLGDANISVQSDFGFDYVQNFMGYRTVFLLSEEEIARGTVIATPIENIVLYYVDPATSDFARAGLNYTTDGDTNLIGFHVQGNYSTAVTESFALMGMVLFAEYLDGIAVITVSDGEDPTKLSAPTVMDDPDADADADADVDADAGAEGE
ncbi:MAG: hypothetical protein LUC17_00035, partial [Oscillospiraceae bacterium]|nr:hypothetical protein [Oscillospiraceae bacterium]